jgi:hypothetical protein
MVLVLTLEGAKMSTQEKQDIQREAYILLEESRYFSRSCWDCNGSKEELEDENEEVVLWCFDCEKYYYKGLDVTEELKPDPKYIKNIEDFSI